ncbi:putative ornithine cyclodeaminase, mu-crystallin [Brevibacillus sp. CF112]|uniref:ornithine cyclodeaminase family protein n=1 Tax=Brevibacillus TaxID=55080 RepID=UPI000271661E|nr:ornithine cyclodeaminase family protein [Brevibacillus sp. CF112]EJL40520.1 putative ornithine cyclodeaminase, mu-crystallin [Brevibacillus sp. CF112]
MFPFRVINQETTEDLLDMASVIEVVEQAYQMKSAQQATLFPMIFHEFVPGKADMDIKSGHLPQADVFGLKLVSWFGDNDQKGLPQLLGTVMVLDSRTGVPQGILSGEHITCMRTGAAGGIGAKYLARPESEHLLMIGTGHQAPFQIMATLMAIPNIKRVSISNPRSHAKAEKFAAEIKDKLLAKFVSKYKGDEYERYAQKCEVEFVAVDDLEAATGQADVIITATPAREPFIRREWVRPGTHITCIGADMEGKQEIDERLFAVGRVFTDDIGQAVRVGETEIPLKKGLITEADIAAEIGSVISGHAAGRQSAEEITIFDSTGIAIQDLLTAQHILRMAESRGAGAIVDL